MSIFCIEMLRLLVLKSSGRLCMMVGDLVTIVEMLLLLVPIILYAAFILERLFERFPCRHLVNCVHNRGVRFFRLVKPFPDHKPVAEASILARFSTVASDDLKQTLWILLQHQIAKYSRETLTVTCMTCQDLSRFHP